MELEILERESLKKKDTKNIRRQGDIPAVLYSAGIPSKNIYIKGSEFKRVMATVKKGALSTSIFTLKSKKETFKAIVKDIQYIITSYDVEHIDFMRLDTKKIITAKVPIRCIGEAECKGIKLGGFLRQTIRTMKVRCLYKDLPEEFILDVKDLEIGNSLRLTEIVLSAKVTPIVRNLNEVAVVISKR